MILEVARLDIFAGQEAGFLRDFKQARAVISSMPGFRDLELKRCIEKPSRFLLLVNWETLKDHTEGFRGSPEYEEWKRLLHHYFEPFPEVEHYERINISSEG